MFLTSVPSSSNTITACLSLGKLYKSLPWNNIWIFAVVKICQVLPLDTRLFFNVIGLVCYSVICCCCLLITFSNEVTKWGGLEQLITLLSTNFCQISVFHFRIKNVMLFVLCVFISIYLVLSVKNIFFCFFPSSPAISALMCSDMSATAMRFNKISFEVKHESKHENMSLNQLV